MDSTGVVAPCTTSVAKRALTLTFHCAKWLEQAADCAIYPEDVAASSWLAVVCAGCDLTEPPSPQSVGCATGADALVPTPAPVPSVETGSGVSLTLPGGGSSE